MIGDVPKGAPIRCRFGRHTEQEKGGLMVYTCGRCGGSFWQKGDYRGEIAMGDAMIAVGDYEGAEALRETTLQRGEAA